MFIVKIFLCAAVGYLLGCVNISILISRAFFRKDVRSCGSGNAGATNMARVFGWKLGLLVLCCDTAKAAFALSFASCLSGDCGLLSAGSACLLGHCFPVFHGFRGGKGVSVGLALAFGIDWRVGLVCVACFLLTTLFSH